MKRIISLAFCVILVFTFCVMPLHTYAGTTLNTPSNFTNIYGFENLNVGVDAANTDDIRDGGICINNESILVPNAALDIKVKKIRTEITDQGADGNGLLWGAGEKAKCTPNKTIWDNQRFWTWFPTLINVSTDPTYQNKTYKNVTDFCFYIDATHFTTQQRRNDGVRGSDVFSVLCFVGVPFIGDDGNQYQATFSPVMGKSFYIQDDNGNWLEKTTSVYELRYDHNSKGDPMICGLIDIPTTYKGYVKVPLENYYPVTYFDLTPADFKLTDYRDNFQLKQIQLHAGFYPEASGAEGDFKGGYVIYDNFGILTDDGSTNPAPVADEPTVAEQPADESKEQESKEDTSKVEESKEDTSKVDDTSEVAVATEETTKKSSTGKVVVIIIIALVVIGGIATYISFAVKKRKKILGVTQSDSATSDDEDSKPDDDTNTQNK